MYSKEVFAMLLQGVYIEKKISKFITKKKLSHHAAEVETNSSEIDGQHAVEIKPTTQAIDITTECLFTIAICNLGLKLGDLVHPHIPTFPHLHVLVVCHIPSSHC
jgi:hypothetical protein